MLRIIHDVDRNPAGPAERRNPGIFCRIVCRTDTVIGCVEICFLKIPPYDSSICDRGFSGDHCDAVCKGAQARDFFRRDFTAADDQEIFVIYVFKKRKIAQTVTLPVRFPYDLLSDPANTV